MKILAVHIHTHDTGVALLNNDKILFASSNERFSRKKMDNNPPLQALRNCFRYYKLTPAEIDHIVFVGRPGWQGLKDFIKEGIRPFLLTSGKFPFWHKDPYLVSKWLFYSLGAPSFIKRQLIPEILVNLNLIGFKGEVSYVPHHYAHLYSAYYTSGWKDCIVGTIEGAGYDQSTSFWDVSRGNFKLVAETNLPHSAGRFYELITLLLGFNRLKHAGKITGLAAYGDPKVAYPKVKKLLWVDDIKLRLDFLKYYRWLADYYAAGELPSELSRFSKEDLAAAFQQRLEECITEIIQKIAKKTKKRRIALAGGVAANVKLNQKIHELPEIDEVHVHQAMGDDGLALGAALRVSYKNGFKPKRPDTVYFGPDFSEREILKVLKEYRIKYTKQRDIEKKIAELLSQNKVVARFNGRMEYGPRALGNRSILYTTTDKSVNDWLNKRLKRTEFMPFAPVTLEEYADKCYKNLSGAEYPARFMTITFDCTSYMKKTSPAVVHVDGTARPQIIRRKDNQSYYKIIKEYHKLTGIPSLINTSFNMHGEPIVCTPEDAIKSFLAGGLDYLAIGNYLVS